MALCRSGRGLLRTEPISLACITVRSAHANFDPSIPRIYKIGSTPLSMQKFVMPLKSFNPTPQGFVPYNAEVEFENTGRKYGFSPTPSPLPSHESLIHGYKPLHAIGPKRPKNPRKACVPRVSFTKDKEIEPHRSVCAFCRSQGEIKATNVLFLNNFLNPSSLQLYPHMQAGLCQYAEKRVLKLVEEAKSHGFLPRYSRRVNPRPRAKLPVREVETRIKELMPLPENTARKRFRPMYTRQYRHN